MSRVSIPGKYRGRQYRSQQEWQKELSDMLSGEDSRDSLPQQQAESSGQPNRPGSLDRDSDCEGDSNESRGRIRLSLALDALDDAYDEMNDDSESDSDESEKPERTTLDCARRPQATSGSRRRGGSSKRKAYSNQDYRYIINAPDDFKRRAIAEAIGMPWKTAQGIVRRFKKTGKVHDSRKDHGVDKSNPKNNPYSETNRGKWGKLSPKYEDYLFQLVHFNCAQTMVSLMDIVNKEMMRDFLLENEDPLTALEVSQGKMHGTVFGIKTLPENERVKGGPLDTTPFENIDEFQDFTKRCLLKSPQTIANHLHKAGFTRKNIIIEKATMNNPSTMAQRLKVAQTLRAIVNGEVENTFLIFQDEMPFYLNHTRKRGLAKKGERAVYRGVPTSNMSFRTQVSMAVNPELGLLVGKQYNPKKIDYVDKHGKRKAKWKSGYTKEDFEDFIHLLMTNIMTLLHDPDTVDLVKGNQIILFIDGAPEHGKKAMEGILNRFEHKKRFDDVLAQNGCRFRQTKLPPNSPHMNLCEYYNRILRAYVGSERNKPEVHREMMRVQGDEEVEPGNIVKNRVDTIHDCIDRAMEKLRNNHGAARGNYLNFSRHLDKIVESNGYLNYYDPM